MTVKPSAKTILQSYSLDQLLHLVKLKVQQDVEYQLEQTRKQLEEISKSMGRGNDLPAIVPIPRKRKPGRPKGSGTVSKPSNAKTRPRKKKPLGKLIQEVVGPEPMSVSDIMKALKKKRYKSKSDNPRRILYIELKKQVEKKTIKKSGRGMYMSS